MSGTMSPDEAAPEMLAAEYVLGTLDEAELTTARARQAADTAFAADIAFWEARLAPLAELVVPVPAPAELWRRIEASTGGVIAPANDNRLAWWRAAAIGGFALAASLAAFIALRPVTAPVQVASIAPPAVALLAPLAGGGAAVLVAVADSSGKIVVRPTGVMNVASDRDLQLWALMAGATKPVSLGVLPATGTFVPPGIAPGTTLLVSLEPKGGSPTGQPTGPVLYGGKLTLLN